MKQKCKFFKIFYYRQYEIRFWPIDIISLEYEDDQMISPLSFDPLVHSMAVL